MKLAHTPFDVQGLSQICWMCREPESRIPMDNVLRPTCAVFRLRRRFCVRVRNLRPPHRSIMSLSRRHPPTLPFFATNRVYVGLRP